MDWVDAIRAYLDDDVQQVSLVELQEGLGLSLGRLWLGLLFGGFCLESQGDRFYGGRIEVGVPNRQGEYHGIENYDSESILNSFKHIEVESVTS
ncbi:hypothetical protein C1752_10378 [Acaryochloris thomasi RCC1774]|uniref:Uncharacterized protein n=1 Tax=Acaryochloris thomasi RCC1774 TaxID=1764569 RepID=A0A2W1JP34_9CYAN|nr:hypothetical protein C1752_10378 [Acaryochloris thomasi RCC1774]